MINFDEYIRQSEPQKREKGYAWQTAIGLQAVDGLKPSDYLIETARKDIEGEITIDEAEQLIRSYYQSKIAHTPEDAEIHHQQRRKRRGGKQKFGGRSHQAPHHVGPEHGRVSLYLEIAHNSEICGGWCVKNQ